MFPHPNFGTLCASCIFTSKCASRRSGVLFLASQLPRVVRTRCVLYIWLEDVLRATAASIFFLPSCFLWVFVILCCFLLFSAFDLFILSEIWLQSSFDHVDTFCDSFLCLVQILRCQCPTFERHKSTFHQPQRTLRLILTFWSIMPGLWCEIKSLFCCCRFVIPDSFLSFGETGANVFFKFDFLNPIVAMSSGFCATDMISDETPTKTSCTAV